MCFFVASGVKEAFLKLAQGVISLHQHNQLSSPPMDPSYSPINSYNTQNSTSNKHQRLKGQQDLQNHPPINVANATGESRCCS